MIVDGKALARKLIDELVVKRAPFGTLTLGIVVTRGNPVTDSYIKIKKRVAAELGVDLIESENIEDVLSCDGVIVQMPLAPDTDGAQLLAQIPVMKDVDVMSDAAYELFTSRNYPPPPVPRAMKYILDVHSVDVSGKNVVVVGQGKLVGRPATEMFRQLGANVSVLELGGDSSMLKSADVIVLGAGDPHFLKPDMIREGVIILDAGTSEMGGTLAGDAHPDCALKAALFTPVPGGIGPIAVAEIFANLFELCARR